MSGFALLGIQSFKKSVDRDLRWNERYPIECRISALAREGSWSDRIIWHDVVEASRVEIIDGCQVLYLKDVLVASSCEDNSRIVCSRVGTFMEALNGEGITEEQAQVAASRSWLESAQ